MQKERIAVDHTAPSSRPSAVIVMAEQSFREVFSETALARLSAVVELVGPLPITDLDSPRAGTPCAPRGSC